MSPELDLVPDPTGAAPESWLPWLELTDAFATELRADVIEREAANVPPRVELARARELGLLDVTIPEQYGGCGLEWGLGLQIARRIARVDSGVAHILAYHYAWTRNLALYDRGAGPRLLAETVRHGWWWASPGSARLVGLVRKRVRDGEIVLDGTVGFATGAPVAQRLYTQVVDDDTKRFAIVAVDPSSVGLTIGEDWDVIGQRLSASPGVRFTDVRVPLDDLVVEFGPVDEPASAPQSISVLNFQVLFAALHLGIAEGALSEAADYVRDKAAPWYHSSAETIVDEPYVVATLGRSLAAVQATAALTQLAEARVASLFARGWDVTAAERGPVAELVASAKVTAIQTALEVSSAVFDAAGARAAGTRYGLDRFWRNARTLSLHDPIAYKHRELGQFLLTGEGPSPSGYR